MTTDTDIDGAWPLPTGRVELLGPEPEEARPVARVVKRIKSETGEASFSIVPFEDFDLSHHNHVVLYAAPPARPVALSIAPVLVRDLAEIIGSTVPDVCNALIAIGREPRSTNMAVSGEEAVAVAQRLGARPVAPAADGAMPSDPLHDDAYLRAVALAYPQGDARRWTLCRIADRIEVALAAPPRRPGSGGAVGGAAQSDCAVAGVR